VHRLVPTKLRWVLTALALGLAAGHAQAATLVVATDRDPDSLDPAFAYASESWQVLVNAGEGLVAYRRAGGTAGAQVVPGLARSMPAVSDGGRRLTFTLRRDARFGPPANRAVRPSDVKASLERLFLARSPGRGLFRGIRGSERFERGASGGISGIVARDGAGEVEISLTRSDPTILHVLALPFAFVLPRGTPASDQSTARVASAGPYRIDDYTRGRSIDLVANAGYRAGAAGSASRGPEAIRVAIGESRGAADRARTASASSSVIDCSNPLLTATRALLRRMPVAKALTSGEL
jgi:peptide/nickel transport system substrate-binding protein